MISKRAGNKLCASCRSVFASGGRYLEKFELSVTKSGGFYRKIRWKMQKNIKNGALIYIKTLIFLERYAKIFGTAV